MLLKAPLKFWFLFVITRILRLWPAYAVSLSNYTFRWSELSISSRWPSNFVSAPCTNDWWKNLLFLNGIWESSCMPWTWYYVSFQLFLVLSCIGLSNRNFCALIRQKKLQQTNLFLKVFTVINRTKRMMTF